MSRKAIVAMALLLAGTEVAAQTPSAQQNQQNQQRARPASQGTVDDLRAELAATNRELATTAQALAAATQRLQEIQEALAELRGRATESRDRIAETSVRLATTGARVDEIAGSLAQLREIAGTAVVPFVLSGSPAPMADATRNAAAATCEAIAGSTMTGEVVYAQIGASIGASQVICRLRPRQ
jgi:predicted RNase H-like nuclease (RuvC/YqgF family)